MYWLIGAIGGAIVGGTMFGAEGGAVTGFAGFIVGLFITNKHRAEEREAQARERATDRSMVTRLETRLEKLEARLARLEQASPAAAAAAATAATAETPVTPAAAETGAPVPPRRSALRVDDVPLVRAPQAATPPLHAASAAASEPSRRPQWPHPDAAAAAPSGPNPIVAWFMGGNTMVRVGLVVLFVGLAFLMKYAADRRILPDELKVAIVGAAGVALLVLGWRLRSKRRGYAISLQGAGVAVLYLTVLAAMRLYALIPPTAAFVVLALVAVFAAILAVSQDALALAVIAAGGGFLAPILVSTGQGSHVTLFSYYLVLNLGLLLIAWHRSWRVLNVLGFAFTFVIGAAWGWRSYQPEHFATTEPFLIVFFLLYVAIAVLYARREAPALRSYVDGTIVFGTPLTVFGLQAGLVRDMEFGLAYSSLAMAGLYVLLATVLNRVGRESYRLLTESFLAMGVVFATLAIPLALDARWTSAAWAIEGAAIYWIGVRQRTALARGFALALQPLAGAAFALAYGDLAAARPLVGPIFVGALLIALGGLVTNRLMHRVVGTGPSVAAERRLAPLMFMWGLGWLIFAGIHEIDQFASGALEVATYLGFFTLLTLAFAWLHDRLAWEEARWPIFGLLPTLLGLAVISTMDKSHPFADFGWVAWPAALLVHTLLLRRLESHADGQKEWFIALHAGAYLLVAALGARELNWLAADVTAHGTSWSVTAVLVVPAALVLWAASARGDDRWPLAAEHFGGAYRNGGAMVLLAAMGVWVLYANATHDGRSDPLPYLPLLNAIDLGHVLVALAAASLWACGRRVGIPGDHVLGGVPALGVGSALTFIWLNAMLLRSIHHWTGVPYTLDDMMRSVLVQSALSIFWALIALTVMVFGTRSARRTPWLLGAGLIGVVVAKLFFIDLSNIGGVERIVSFIGVGVLMLVIAYFSPVPPRVPSDTTNRTAETAA